MIVIYFYLLRRPLPIPPLFPYTTLFRSPGPTAVTSPLPFTMATDPSDLIHVTTRPRSTPPFASCNVAKSCTVPPTCRLEDAGLTMTDATGAGGGGGSAVTVAVPFLPSLVTVIAAVPAATPVTSPLPFTMETDTSLQAPVPGVFHVKDVTRSPFQITL